MVKLHLILLIMLQAFNHQIEEIYVGKSFTWTVYFDSNKVQPIVEIGGIKYGHLDYLKSEGETFARSHEGKLYHKRGKLFYKNETLKINVELKKKQYSVEIDNHRQMIFEFNAFSEISKLKDSLKVDSYEFDWQVKEDYIFYRETISIPEKHTPNYKKAFYNSLK